MSRMRSSLIGHRTRRSPGRNLRLGRYQVEAVNQVAASLHPSVRHSFKLRVENKLRLNTANASLVTPTQLRVAIEAALAQLEFEQAEAGS